MKLCDLHTHSVYSDGTWTPVQLLDEAERIGLAAIAMTDHNTVAGLPDFLAAAEGREVEAVPGVEFSTDFENKDVHILALFVKPEHFRTVTELLADAQRRKAESNRELIANLNRAGYALDYDAICAMVQDGEFNRAHVAQELTRLGYTRDSGQAFRELLDAGVGYYHPPKRMSPEEAVALIRSIGAVSVLAHPLLTFSDEAQLRRLLDRVVPQGLEAMETVYVTYDEETTRRAKNIAAEYGLKESGGSDFHGLRKPDIRLGEGRGGLKVPCSLLENLKRR